jgi:hypothetical protein
MPSSQPKFACAHSLRSQTLHSLGFTSVLFPSYINPSTFQQLPASTVSFTINVANKTVRFSEVCFPKSAIYANRLEMLRAQINGAYPDRWGFWEWLGQTPRLV